jgi:hypothetical protein
LWPFRGRDLCGSHSAATCLRTVVGGHDCRLSATFDGELGLRWSYALRTRRCISLTSGSLATRRTVGARVDIGFAETVCPMAGHTSPRRTLCPGVIAVALLGTTSHRSRPAILFTKRCSR